MAMNERAALNLWRRALTSYVRTSDGDLTARQQAILMTVALSAGPHTIRGLATDLDLAKPAVTRAVDAPEKLGFVRRRRDEHDLRSVIIERTVQGMTWLREFAELIIAAEAGEERKSAAGTKPLDKNVAA